jgi:hypothetical protein
MLKKDELLEVVASDLIYLKREWGQDIDDDSLRRGSTVLRRLLVNGELQRAWKSAGFSKEPQLTASSLTPILEKIVSDKIIFAAAGGANYKGCEVRGALWTNYAMGQDELQDCQESGVPTKVFGLKDFIEAPCVVVKGKVIARRVLIKYIANKLGGAHHDHKRGHTDEESLFRLLDWARAQVRILEKPAVYFELLSVGQALVASPNLSALCSKVRGETLA